MTEVLKVAFTRGETPDLGRSHYARVPKHCWVYVVELPLGAAGKTRMLRIKSVWSMETFTVHKCLVKLPGNPRWLLNGLTYIAPNTLEYGGPQDHFTIFTMPV